MEGKYNVETMVSIIVPTFNREGVIGRALRSILRQTYSSFEIIVVDDGSTDGTESVVSGLQDSRIRYIALDKNQGVAHARNVGIQEAKYDYIAFLDSDDEWLSDKLELQMEKMLNSSEKFGLVYCRMGGLRRDGMGRYVCPHQDYVKETLEGNLFQPLLQQNVIGMPTIVARRECLDQAGGFKETLRCLEDWELILRIAKQWEIGFVDKILVEVHKTEGSVTTNMGEHLITRCYMVSLYRQEMTQMGIIDRVKEDILEIAENTSLYAETKELLNRDIRL